MAGLVPAIHIFVLTHQLRRWCDLRPLLQLILHLVETGIDAVVVDTW
jgi:hypothetical protein